MERDGPAGGEKGRDAVAVFPEQLGGRGGDRVVECHLPERLAVLLGGRRQPPHPHGCGGLGRGGKRSVVHQEAAPSASQCGFQHRSVAHWGGGSSGEATRKHTSGISFTHQRRCYFYSTGPCCRRQSHLSPCLKQREAFGIQGNFVQPNRVRLSLPVACEREDVTSR